MLSEKQTLVLWQNSFLALLNSLLSLNFIPESFKKESMVKRHKICQPNNSIIHENYAIKCVNILFTFPVFLSQT